jgi:hypothetical protein
MAQWRHAERHKSSRPARIAPTVNFHKSYHSAADSRHEHCFDDLAGEHRSEMDETYHPFSEYFRLLYC